MGILDSFYNFIPGIPGIIMVMILSQSVIQTLAQQETAGNSTGSAAKERYIPSREEFDQSFKQHQQEMERSHNTAIAIFISVPLVILVGVAVVFIVICLRRKRRGAGMMNGPTGQIMAPAQQYNAAYGNYTGGQSQYSGQQFYGQQYQQPNATTTI